MKFEWRSLYAAYVNLLSRNDRDLHMMRELDRVGLKAVRYPGTSTKGEEWNHPPYFKLFARTPGAIGCMISQMGIMRAAHAMGKGAMVFEDDLVFASDIQERLDYIENFVNTKAPDTDTIFLGGTVHINPGYWHTNGHYPDIRGLCSCTLNRDAERIDDEKMIRVYGMFSTHAYIIPFEKIPKILSLLDMVMEKSYGIDFSFIMLEPELKCYAFVPGSVKQIDNRSDIGSGDTIFSNFKSLGPHWFQDKISDFDYSTFNL